jgi:hypothetical protein
MLKIFVKIASVDMYGFNGRDFHPTPDMVGQLVRVIEMETFSTYGGSETYQVFSGFIVDANGDDTDVQVQLIDFELESKHGIPVLYGQEVN